MQDSPDAIDFGPAAHFLPGVPGGPGEDVIFVCEHASNRIPGALRGLGLSPDAQRSHVAWDPGALALAQLMAERIGAPLVHGGVSRLVYDCNRPPEAASAIPDHVERFEIPGNTGLSAADRAARTDAVYRPFHELLSDRIRALRPMLRLMVTIHSFTPVFMGKQRDVEIGLLHGKDPSFARMMVDTAPAQSSYVIRLNEPYSAADGVAHTLNLQGVANGLANVMLEIRSDLIATGADQARMAELLTDWIGRASAGLRAEGAA